MISAPLRHPPNVAKPLLQRLKQNLSNSFRPQTPEDKVLFWSGFMYAPSAVLTPLITRWQLQQANTPKYEENLMVRSEVVRQVIGAAAHFVGFFGGMAVSGLGGAKGSKPKTLRKLIGSVVGATLGYAFLRPLALNAYMARWVKNQHQTAAPTIPNNATDTPSTPGFTTRPLVQAHIDSGPRLNQSGLGPYQKQLQPILNRLA